MKYEYLLIIRHYMEEEVYKYNSLKELLNNWNCKTLKELEEELFCINFEIYKAKKIYKHEGHY